jgi:metabolite-proton symporter
VTATWKVALASTAGTAIEWYDFLVYGTVAALVFNRLFFPEFESALGTLAALATFAGGYCARPLGAAVFGHVGDTLGRKPMLVWTLLVMGCATALIGLLPTYDQAGVLAPVALLLLRLVQGVGLGGEWGGAVLMAFEHAPAGRRGFFASWPQLGAPAGLLLANVVVLALSSRLSDSDFVAWGWRVPFLLSTILVALGLLLRRTAAESPAFRQIAHDRAPLRQPFVEVLRRHRHSVFLGASTRAAEAGFVVIFSTFILSHATQTGDVARSAVLSALVLATSLQLVLVPVAGRLCDRFGRRRTFVAGASIATVTALPACLLIDTRQVPLVTVGIVLGMLGPAIIFGPQASLLAELFPAHVRSSGASLGFQFGGVLSGGLAPLVAAVLVGATGNLLMLGVYMLMLGLISLASVALGTRASIHDVAPPTWMTIPPESSEAMTGSPRLVQASSRRGGS